MEKQNYLSNLSQFEGLSLREIAERSGHNFRTVKKYVDKENWNEEYKARKERVSLIEPLKPVIDEWIGEDLKRSRKNRRTGTKIYNDLAKHPEHVKKLKVGKQTVINYVSRRKKELRKKTYETAMFGLHAMCEAQVDFGDITVVLPNGSEEVWHELVMSFPWSNRDRKIPARATLHARVFAARFAAKIMSGICAGVQVRDERMPAGSDGTDIRVHRRSAASDTV